MNAYSHKVNPVNGRDMWAKFECTTALLPQKVNPQIGHNKRGCEANVSSDGGQRATTMPKKTMGRKRYVSQPGNEASTQGSQASAGSTLKAATQGSQASVGSTFKRTKMTTSRLTPDKSKK
ncbi:hypothetical protein Tco_1573343 [Tanacetum coccineum]